MRAPRANNSPQAIHPRRPTPRGPENPKQHPARGGEGKRGGEDPLVPDMKYCVLPSALSTKGMLRHPGLLARLNFVPICLVLLPLSLAVGAHSTSDPFLDRPFFWLSLRLAGTGHNQALPACLKRLRCNSPTQKCALVLVLQLPLTPVAGSTLHRGS